MAAQLTDDEATRIRRNFRKCSDEAVAAILRFRESRDVACIEPIVRGIVARYLPEQGREAIKSATAETPLADLRIESLTMLEIVLDVQDALEVEIADSELRGFRTLGDVEQFLAAKVSAPAA